MISTLLVSAAGPRSAREDGRHDSEYCASACLGALLECIVDGERLTFEARSTGR